MIASSIRFGRLVVASAAASLLAAAAFAQVPPQSALKEGVTYTLVKPVQPTTAPAGKVEVIEFFGYWCPHCNEFEPTMRDWASRNASKVEMQYVPVAFRPDMANLQKLYYTLEAMGREKELRSKVFNAIHEDRSLPFNADPDAIAKWAEKNGIDRKKFVDTFNSFTVQSKVNRANQLAQAYGVSGVPQLGLAGKYVLNVDARSIANADTMLARVQSEK